MIDYPKRFQEALERHLFMSREVSKHLLKIGKKETSAHTSHEVTIEDDGDAHIKTTINLLPIRRMYRDGSVIIDDDYLLYEMPEDIEL